MKTTTNTEGTKTPDRSELIAQWKRLGRSLANEFISESDARALRRAIERVQAEIDAINVASQW
jgi:hypothetical protein